MTAMEYRIEAVCPLGQPMPDAAAMATITARALERWAEEQGIPDPDYDVHVPHMSDDL